MELVAPCSQPRPGVSCSLLWWLCTAWYGLAAALVTTTAALHARLARICNNSKRRPPGWTWLRGRHADKSNATRNVVFPCGCPAQGLMLLLANDPSGTALTRHAPLPLLSQGEGRRGRRPNQGGLIRWAKQHTCTCLPLAGRPSCPPDPPASPLLQAAASQLLRSLATVGGLVAAVWLVSRRGTNSRGVPGQGAAPTRCPASLVGVDLVLNVGAV